MTLLIDIMLANPTTSLTFGWGFLHSPGKEVPPMFENPTLKTISAAIGGASIGYFIGGVDAMMKALLLFMALDYLTGVMCAVLDKSLSSAVGFRGIFKKIMILLLAGMSHIVDTHVIGSGNAIRSAVLCFYICNEGISILENAGLIHDPE